MNVHGVFTGIDAYYPMDTHVYLVKRKKMHGKRKKKGDKRQRKERKRKDTLEKKKHANAT